MAAADIHQRLSEQQAFADALLSVLEQETAAVVAGDVDKLNGLLKLKTERCAQLDDMGREMNHWLKGRSIDEWLKHQDRQARGQWEKLADTLRNCQRKNDANGLLISRRQEEIEELLKPRNGTTYGASGQSESQSDSSVTFRA